MHDPLQRLYRTKLVLLAVLLIALGLALLFLGHWLPKQPGWQWIAGWPITDIGSGLFTTGLLSVALQYFDGQDSEARATERLERVLSAAAPAMRDAVIDGFAFEPADLARVAAPETLDKIITNGLAIRLNDPGFASEIYADVRQQAVGSPERLHDARISIRLSTPEPGDRLPAGLFVATVRWEYTLTPVFGTRRFITVSNIDEFRDSDHEAAATSVWLLKPRPGVDAGDQACFQLVEFTVDGEPRPIRRTAKHGGQTYSVSLGADVIRDAQPVRVGYTYRTVTDVSGHVLRLRVDQPTRGLAVELDYSDTDIASIDVLDYIASSEPTTVSQSPPAVPGRGVVIDFDGWVFPRSGVAFVWVLQGELRAPEMAAIATRTPKAASPSSLSR